MFEYLAAMPNLRRVELFGTKATEQAANKFQRGRGVEVDFNPGGARLGIRDGLGNGGALVGEVAINSPAARAGLTPGDVIVSVDGNPVGEARSVTSPRSRWKEHIKGKVIRPGDSAECRSPIRPPSGQVAAGRPRLRNHGGGALEFDRWKQPPQWSGVPEGDRERSSG